MIDHELMLSETLKEIKPSGIRKFFDLLADMGDVTALTVGQPDFGIPPEAHTSKTKFGSSDLISLKNSITFSICSLNPSP